MINKIKAWILGTVIMKKVIGKLAKHATGAIVGFISASWFVVNVAPWLDKLGMEIDPSKLEVGLVVILTGLFGAGWNYIEHRFVK